MGKVIAIMSGKGGVGKTTMTAYIGAAFKSSRSSRVNYRCRFWDA